MKKIIIVFIVVILSCTLLKAQRLLPFNLPETGQNTSYTATQGEDADWQINPISFTDNGNGTITDNNTGLIWQKTDGGEMTFSNAINYCNNLTLAGYSDWRLPTDHELFSINSYDDANPALDTFYFTKTAAEYWYTGQTQVNDTSKVWVVNAGGGIGAHPKSETVSAGGNKRFHVRAVRDPYSTTFSVSHFTDNGNGTIKDNFTGLIWQQIQSPDTLTWEDALAYAATLALGGQSDWRLPNVKEVQALNDVSRSMPSFNTMYFSGITNGNYWTSTTLKQPTPNKAWDINVDYGIVSYHLKTSKQHVLCVRGGLDKSDLNINEVLIPADTFEMGDHHGFTDSIHPTDEIPLHFVKLDSFYIMNTETTNQQFLAFLNCSKIAGTIEVRGDSAVYGVGGSMIYCYLHNYKSYYNISYNGHIFTMANFRAYHPMVGVRWYGCAAFCNWLSTLYGIEQCYNLHTGYCDFTKYGYRLPTEAEWEYAGRGGSAPYYKYPWGNDLDVTKANWPSSGDPYESSNPNIYPLTTPVGFYNGSLHLKSEYQWPGTATSYQTANGANAFGLYDMAGNVWEFINDWYKNNYYGSSPIDNPIGPDSISASNMPDGKKYKGMRGGNWYNGDMISGVDDGHSRVSNRDPSYFRGPQDPYHPWYHVGLRVVRKFDPSTVGINEQYENITGSVLYQNYPNPFSIVTSIRFDLSSNAVVILKIYNALGEVVNTLVNTSLDKGQYSYDWNAGANPAGTYYYKLQIGDREFSKKLILLK